jgi:acetylornithine deacetylase/succinyl-diaminopimelate desuccinylase-like protein
VKEAETLAQTKGRDLCDKFNMLPGVEFINHNDIPNLYLNNTWRANLSITGAEGLPHPAKARNGVRASTTVRLSCRLSPIFDCEKAVEIITKKVTTDVPYNAQVKILGSNGGNGWCMKVLEPWLSTAIQEAALSFFNKPAGSYGDGGSIPFLMELGNKYPETQIIALGVGGPYSNMHGPNEMLELTYAKKLTCSIAHILAGCTH